MTLNDQQKEKTIEWLLESDDPGVRYLVLRDLIELPEDDVEFVAAQELAHTAGPIAQILLKE